MPAGARREHHQQRPQTLAATGDDVLGDLVHQRHGALQARPNDPVHRVEVGLYQRANLFQGHWQEGGVFLGRVGALGRPRIVADRGGFGEIRSGGTQRLRLGAKSPSLLRKQPFDPEGVRQ